MSLPSRTTTLRASLRTLRSRPQARLFTTRAQNPHWHLSQTGTFRFRPPIFYTQSPRTMARKLLKLAPTKPLLTSLKLDLTFPTDLPRPEDDGACNHLPGKPFPSISLPSTAGNTVSPSALSGLTILFCYPRTGAPNETIPDSWNAIPGARGCTPQACSFRDSSRELLELGVSHIFGVSTQDTPYQQEVKERVHLPYQLLSDEELELVNGLELPTFEWEGKKLIKRLTMAIEDGKIVKVFYPVFPPDQSANEVLKWLKSEYQGRQSLSTEEESAMMRNMQKK